jgi:hypothetical protein
MRPARHSRGLAAPPCDHIARIAAIGDVVVPCGIIAACGLLRAIAFADRLGMDCPLPWNVAGARSCRRGGPRVSRPDCRGRDGNPDRDNDHGGLLSFPNLSRSSFVPDLGLSSPALSAFQHAAGSNLGSRNLPGRKINTRCCGRQRTDNGFAPRSAAEANSMRGIASNRLFV